MSTGPSPRCALEGFLKDVLFVSVGLGVLGFQRAQVARRELNTLLSQVLDLSGPTA